MILMVKREKIHLGTRFVSSYRWLSYPHETWFQIGTVKLSRGRAGFDRNWMGNFILAAGWKKKVEIKQLPGVRWV